MKITLNEKSLEKLRDIINEESTYRTGYDLVKLFNKFGFNDRYGQGFPSRWYYTDQKLKALNGTEKLYELILYILNPIHFIEEPDKLKTLISSFNKFLAFDGYKIVLKGARIELVPLKNPSEVISAIYSEKGQNKVFTIDIQCLNLSQDLEDTITKRIDELRKLIQGGCNLSAIIIMGSILEGILFGFAKAQKSLFYQSPIYPKTKNGKPAKIEDLRLKDFLAILREREVIDDALYRHSDIVRDFRNYIHVAKWLSEKPLIRDESVEITIDVLNSIIKRLCEITNMNK